MSWKPAIDAIEKRIAEEQEAATRLSMEGDELSAQADVLSKSGSYAESAEKYREAAKKYNEASATETRIVGKIKAELAILSAYNVPPRKGY